MVVPTYNEVDNLELDRRARCCAPSRRPTCWSSTTGRRTAPARSPTSWPHGDSRVPVVHRTEKAGLGAAYLHGFAVALERGYDVVGEMDADGSHQPEQLPRLVEALADADLVIGARWVPGGSVVNWSPFRKALSVGGNLYARLLLGIPVHDVTAGFRLFRADHAAGDRPRRGRVGGLLLPDRPDAAHAPGRAAASREVPIEFLERERGESKMNRAVATESLRRITRWGLRGTRGPGARRSSRRRADGTARRRRHGRASRSRRRVPWWVLAAAVRRSCRSSRSTSSSSSARSSGRGGRSSSSSPTACSAPGWSSTRAARAWRALQEALDSGRMPATRARRRRAHPGRRHAADHARLRQRRRRALLHPAVHPPAGTRGCSPG